MTQTQKEAGQSPEVFQHTETFFDAHRNYLNEVFEAVGLDHSQTDTLEHAVQATQPWVKGDHSRPLHEWHLSDTQKTTLQPLYDKLGMVHEVPLPANHYDQIIVLGAIARGTTRRVDFVRRMIQEGGVETDSIVMLGGQRPLYPERETEDVQDTLDEIATKGTAGKWPKANSKTPEVDWETDMIRLSMLAKMGALPLKQLHLRLNNADPVKRYEFEWEGIPISLVHALAVPRENGESRHTTESCVEEWLKTYHPSKGKRIGFVGANPHLNRMGRSAQRVVDNLGREDLKLIVGGPAAPPVRDSIYLGEIARSLYEDLQSFKVS